MHCVPSNNHSYSYFPFHLSPESLLTPPLPHTTPALTILNPHLIAPHSPDGQDRTERDGTGRDGTAKRHADTHRPLLASQNVASLDGTCRAAGHWLVCMYVRRISERHAGCEVALVYHILRSCRTSEESAESSPIKIGNRLDFK